MITPFRYRAATPTGQVVEGILQAGNSHAAADELRRRTLVPVAVEPVEARGRARQRWLGRADAVAVAIRTLSTLLAAGLPLDRALAFCAGQAARPDVAAALQSVLADVRAGVGFAAALERQQLFGTFIPAVVRAGEESGNLDQTLDRLAAHVERSRDLANQLRGALMYPALMAVTAGAGVLVLLTFVVPRFATMLSGAGQDLPLLTRMLVGASALVSEWWVLWLLIAGAMVMGGRYWLADPVNRRRLHDLRLRLPVVGELELQVATARYTRALGELVGSGMPLLPALELARDVIGNEALRSRIAGANAAVARGERLASALDGALPPIAIQLIGAGEETGQLEAMSLRVAERCETDADRFLRQAIRLVEPALILVFGVIVGFIALSMLQAIYSINSGVL